MTHSTALKSFTTGNPKSLKLERGDSEVRACQREGSAIIIEFKAPDVGLQEHMPDLAQYARLLAAKSNGRIKKFYGYLIGCTIDPNRMEPGYTQFANGRGFFKSDPLRDFATGRSYGELYTEVLLYQQFIDREEARLRVYKDKLRVQLD